MVYNTFNYPVVSLRSSGVSSDGGSGDEPLNVSLTLAGLQSFHGLATADMTEDCMTTFAKNGRDKQRIKTAVQSPSCSCGCTVPFQIIFKICVAFWSLTKSAQDSILWSIQTSGGGRRKKYYHIEGSGFTLLCIFLS